MKLETDPAGRTVTGVVVSRDGDREVYEADIVSVSSGAANSAKLLLGSANDAHPNGLANGSDQVGRNYMFHNSKAAVALSKEPNDTVFQKTLGLNDFYLGTPDYSWPIGNIQMVGKSNAEAMKGEEPKLTKLAPHWSLADVAKHAVDFWLTTEDLPLPENRVTVDGDGKVHLAYRSSNDERSEPAVSRDEADPESRRPAAAPRAGQELLHGHVDRQWRASRTRPAPVGSAPIRTSRYSM